MKVCSTHQEGDGIVFVTEVESVTNIRTGAVDRAALLVT
jgi:nitrogen regulatory protein PII